MGKLIKVIAYIIIALVVILVIAGLMYQTYLAYQGIKNILAGLPCLTPEQVTAMMFNLLCLALLLPTLTHRDRWNYMDMPDISPAELCRQLKGFFLKKIHSKPIKHHRHSEIL